MDDLLKEIQNAIAQALCTRIGRDRFDLWFSNESTFAVQDNGLTVSALDEFSINCIRQQFAADLRMTVDQVLGAHASIDYCSQSADSSQPDQMRLFQDVDAASGTKSDRRRPGKRCSQPVQPPESNANDQVHHQDVLPSEPRRPADKTLGCFHFGPDNELLKTAVQQILRTPGRFSPLVIHGPPGCGKSHLLEAMVHRARRTSGFRRVMLMTAEQFTSSFVEAVGGRNLTLFRRKYRDLDLLAIDDIHFFDGKRATLIEFQNTVESLLRSGKQMIVSCDQALHELDFLMEELRTRLACGLICPMTFPDESSRKRIIRDLARKREMELPAAVVQLIAEKIPRDVRLLSGALNRLKAASLVHEATIITTEMATESLADLFQSQVPVLSIARIEKTVCDVCGIDSTELRSSKRIKRVSTARMLAMWLSRKHTCAALSEIGEHYGGRSHSTVVAAGKKIERMLQENGEVQLRNSRCAVRAAISRIESDLRVG